MTVFKAFLKVLNKCKMPIIMYTVFLVFFSVFNTQSNDNNISFEATKPDLLIINKDVNDGITKHMINYLSNNANIIEVDDSEEARDDALFYRDVNYIIYIPKNFRSDILKGDNPVIEIKSTGDYQSSLASLLLERYMKLIDIYRSTDSSESEIINMLDNTLDNSTHVEVLSKIDNVGLSKATNYYNFSNYCLIAGSIYVIALILTSFKEENIKKRTIVSSMNIRVFNRKLLLSNGLFSLGLWLFYTILAFILMKEVMISTHGLLYIINSFIFSICILTLAFLIGNAIHNKDAINGIVNVIALGSSFLCGAFVPMEWLPDTVLKIAHVLPSYWFIKNNEYIKLLENFNFDSIKPFLFNTGMILVFSLVFVLVCNVIVKRKRRID